MADNAVLSAAVGVGITAALDDIGGVHYPRSKIVIGADGVNDGDVSSANPMPVSGPVTNAGTFAVQINGDALTALQLIDNAISGAGFNITQFAGAAVPIGAGLEATAVRVTIATDSTGVLSIDDNGGAITVDNGGTFAVQAAQSGTWNVTNISGTISLPTGAATAAKQPALGTAGTASTDVITVQGIASGTVIPVSDGGGILTVDGTVAATQSGTWNVGTVTTVTTVSAVTTVTTVTTCGTVTTLTGSGVAHDGADSGNPHKVGARAVTSVSAQTLVAANDRTDLFAGLDGVQITRPHCNLEDVVTGNATNTDGTSTQCVAAQAAGIKTYLTSIVLANSSASNITVDIKDGSTTKISIPVPAGGGAIFNPPVPLPGTAATAWNFDPSAAATTVTCSMIGFKSKV